MFLLVASALIALASAFPASTNDGATRDDPFCGITPVDSGAEPVPRTNIYGGWDALPGEWPWMISMRNNPDSAFHYCGGSIIADEWVLTAAHCCEGETPGNTYVAVGEHDFANPNQFVEVIGVSEIHMHPNFGPVTLVNDTCLMRLERPIIYSSNVNSVCSPDATFDYDGAVVSTSGWGNTESGPNRGVLLTVNLHVVNNSHCYEEISEFQPTWFVSQDMICAGHDLYEVRDTCQGDSGGPMVYKNATGSWQLLGLTSWGYGCADSAPGVYCRVQMFLDWYESIMNP